MTLISPLCLTNICQSHNPFRSNPDSFNPRFFNMADGGFVTGWEQYTSHNQITRSAASETGYTDAATLVHLARALYFPRHDRKTTHLAVHDMSAQSAAATGSLPIGCTRYMVAVGGMPKPQGDGPDDITVAYDVNFNLRNGDAVVGSVKCRAPSSSLAEVELYVAISLNIPKK